MSIEASSSQSAAEALQKAEEIAKSDPSRAERLLKSVLDRSIPQNDETALREKETALLKLGELYRDQGYV